MDLISRKALLEDIGNTISESSDTFDWINLINKQSTAYDVDKIVEEIEDLPHGEYKDDYGKGFSAGVKACIKSVKGGLEE